MVIQKQLRILPGILHIENGIEDDALHFREFISQKSTLPNLPCAGDNDSWERFQ